MGFYAHQIFFVELWHVDPCCALKSFEDRDEVRKRHEPDEEGKFWDRVSGFGKYQQLHLFCAWEHLISPP